MLVCLLLLLAGAAMAQVRPPVGIKKKQAAGQSPQVKRPAAGTSARGAQAPAQSGKAPAGQAAKTKPRAAAGQGKASPDVIKAPPPPGIPPASKVTDPAALLPLTDDPNSTKVELVQADALEGGKYKGKDIRKLIGNVILKQGATLLHCDSAYQYKDRNDMECFGNVRINQADTVTLTGDHLTYYGDKRLAKMRGNVVLQDSKMTVSAPSMDYDMNTKVAYYTEGGNIVDAENQLSSKFGSYNTGSKMFAFKGSVQLNTKDSQITTDTLRYSTLSKIAYFYGDTRIQAPQGTITAQKGEYDTTKKISSFSTRAQVETPEYFLAGEYLYYDEQSGYGKALGKVKVITKKDSTVLTGQVAQYWRKQGLAKVYGNAIMRQPDKSRDTLFLAADTLLSIDRAPTDTLGDVSLAYHHVRIYRSDLQGRCDSMAYHSADSTIYLYTDPILWSGKNQLTAEHIRLRMGNKQLQRMEMLNSAFVVAEDTLRNYNQVKGRDMTAHFRENRIRRVDVFGNGESIYFALEGDTALTGMNYAICSNIRIMLDSNKVESISFIQQPDAKFIPPHELNPAESRLNGFAWRMTEKPAKEAIFTQPAADITEPDLKPRKAPPSPLDTKKKPAATAKPAITPKKARRPGKAG